MHGQAHRARTANYVESVMASLLNAATAGLAHIRVLDPHSPVLLAQLHGAEAMHPDALVAYALAHIERVDGRPAVVVVPDAGAFARTLGILSRLNAPNEVARCSKKRDSQTGKLSGFYLDEGEVAGRTVVIVDDICDGGGTFSGVAKVLREHGAAKVHLCVTHGTFFKGIVTAGIDTVFSTDSYRVADGAGFEAEADGGDDSALVYRREGGQAGAIAAICGAGAGFRGLRPDVFLGLCDRSRTMEAKSKSKETFLFVTSCGVKACQYSFNVVAGALGKVLSLN